MCLRDQWINSILSCGAGFRIQIRRNAHQDSSARGHDEASYGTSNESTFCQSLGGLLSLGQQSSAVQLLLAAVGQPRPTPPNLAKLSGLGVSDPKTAKANATSPSSPAVGPLEWVLSEATTNPDKPPSPRSPCCSLRPCPFLGRKLLLGKSRVPEALATWELSQVVLLGFHATVTVALARKLTGFRI